MFAERHTVVLPTLSKAPVDVGAKEVSPVKIATQWINKFEAALNVNDVSQLASIMHPDSWWRDMLALSWDLRTLRGIEKISSYVGDNQSRVHLHNVKLRSEGKFTPEFKTPAPGITWIESIFDFATDVGKGTGVIRLLEDANGTWKGCMVYTALQELNGHKEISGVNRPHGGNNSLIGGALKGNWLERRQRKVEFLDEEPTVLITGAGKSTPFPMCLGLTNIIQGQAGLNLAARLQSLGVSTLLVDRNERVGDNWRHRYRVSYAETGETAMRLTHCLVDARHPRSDPILPYGLPSVPFNLAAVHRKGQAWRLARSICQHHGAQCLEQEYPQIHGI